MYKGVCSRALGFVVFFTIVLGLVYTLVVTGIAQVFFPYQANGSVITVDGKTYGSELLGQRFEDANHMWGRVTNLSIIDMPDGTQAVYSGPSNASPAQNDAMLTPGDEEEGNSSFQATIDERVQAIKEANPDADLSQVPADLVTNSGSGLDPNISVDAANYQVARLAKNTGKSEDEIRQIIQKCTTGRFLGIWGEPVVNVLKVNLMLDGVLS